MTGTRAPNRLSRRAKLALILLPTLLLLGLVEGGTRAFLWLRYGRMVEAENWTFEYEPYLVVKKTDSIRRNFPLADDQYRVLVLGGSTADQIPDALLEEAVARYTDREVVIMNLGAGGYIINQERVMLMLRGIESKPDLMITLDGANDFVTASKLRRTGETYHAGLVSLAVEHPFLNALFAVARKSQFVGVLVKLRERRVERATQGDAELEAAILDHLIASWDSIAAVAHGLDIPYVMVLQPYLHLKESLTEKEKAAAPEYDYRREFMAKMFRAAYARMSTHSFVGDPYVLDATAWFDDMDDVDVFRDEVHLTEAGNERLVREMLRIPFERGLRFPQRGD